MCIYICIYIYIYIYLQRSISVRLYSFDPKSEFAKLRNNLGWRMEIDRNFVEGQYGTIVFCEFVAVLIQERKI